MSDDFIVAESLIHRNFLEVVFAEARVREIALEPFLFFVGFRGVAVHFHLFLFSLSTSHPSPFDLMVDFLGVALVHRIHLSFQHQKNGISLLRMRDRLAIYVCSDVHLVGARINHILKVLKVMKLLDNVLDDAIYFIFVCRYLDVLLLKSAVELARGLGRNCFCDFIDVNNFQGRYLQLFHYILFVVKL